MRSFVVAGSNAAELLELIEEAFDVVALSVDGPFSNGPSSSVAAVGDVWNGTLSPDMSANAIGIVAFVSNDDRVLPRPSSSAAAQVTSCTSPGEIRRQTGRPFASTRAWIFVVRPSRFRPTQRSPLFV